MPRSTPAMPGPRAGKAAPRPGRARAARRVPVAVFPYVAGALAGATIVTVLSAYLSRPDEARRTSGHETRGLSAWTELPFAHYAIPPHAAYLRGVRIVVDPGHVGQRDRGGTWKRGPTGLREAQVNLRVAQELREFLLAAGADVLLTRDEDRSLDLPDDQDLEARAAVANRARADLLLSIHHNAASDPNANYSTVFYHGDPTNNAASVCAARYLLHGLQDALRLERHQPCGLLSDGELYPNEGFAVLRHAEVPAVLTEASFHSNPDEERRLRDPAYNRREAYGLFLGLARWASAGLPGVVLAEPADGVVRRGQTLVVQLDDGLSARGGWGADAPKILEDTIAAKVNGRAVSWQFDARRRRLSVVMPRDVQPGDATLFVDFANIFGQHVLHPRVLVRVR